MSETTITLVPITKEEKAVSALWDYLCTVEGGRLRWGAYWRCKVIEHAQNQVGLWPMLECRSLEQWIKWNIEAAD